MAADIIQAEYDRLDKISGRFGQQMESVTEMRQHMERNVHALQNGGWEGQGSDAFFSEMDGDIFPAIKRLTQALEQAQLVTLQVKDILKTAEEEASQPFRGDGDGRDYAGKKGKLDEKARISGYEKSNDPLFVSGPGGENAIHPNDISQGQLGDCFFVTSMASVASQNPNLIKNAIQDNGDGTYTVTFYEKGGGFLGIGESYQPVKVTVTPDFPTREVYDKETGTWVKDANAPHIGQGDNELWPRILEKGYAQWKGGGDATKGYQILNEGGKAHNVFEALSGQDSKSTTDMDKYNMKELEQLHKNGHVITLSSLDTKNGGKSGKEGYYKAGTGELHTTHAYWVESVDAANDKIVVRNPWGYQTSAKHRIELSYKDFVKSFDRIDTNSLQSK